MDKSSTYNMDDLLGIQRSMLSRNSLVRKPSSKDRPPTHTFQSSERETKSSLQLFSKLRLRLWHYSNGIDNDICAACRRIFNNKKAFSEGQFESNDYKWHKTVERLFLSARNGCQICQLFLGSIEGLSASNRDSVNLLVEPLVLVMLNVAAGKDSETAVWIETKQRGEHGQKFILRPSVEFEPSLFTKSGASCTVSITSGPCRGPLLSRNSKDALPLAKEWLDRCEAHHEICNSTRQASSVIFPSRLLYLDKDIVQLQLAVEYGSSPRYATLSHRWGDLDILILRSQDIESFRRGIDHNALCKTFQDAIHITKMLGLAYLWIDSLCIVQDDPQDWAHEAARMGSVYGGAVVTIAATTAEDGSRGCFFDRDPNFVASHQFIGHAGKVLVIGYRGLTESCLSDGPLNSRAWVFQERLLSPRVLSMTSKQIVWECIEGYACESFPDGCPKILEPKSNSAYAVNRMSKDGLLSQKISTNTKSEENAPPSWPAIVERYTRMDITFKKDRLPALAGIARKYQNVLGFDPDSYVAGLWRPNLEEQLLWKSLDEREPYDVDIANSALVTTSCPSWSWANADSPIHFIRASSNETFVSITQIAGIPSGSAAYGEISSASLEIETEYLGFVKLERIEGSRYCMTGFYPVLPDTTTIPVEKREVLRVDIFWDYPQHRRPEIVYFLPIIRDWCFRGLILEKSEQRRGEYRRCGLFETIYPMKSEDSQLFEKSMRGTNPADCARVIEGEKRNYVITLV